MAAANRKRASRTARSKTTTTKAEAKAPATSDLVEPLSGDRAKIKSAKTATSKVEAGGAKSVDEKAIRMESEGVLTPIKSDFDNPESPVVGDPAGALVGPEDPGKVKVGLGETAQQHEAHVLLSHPERIAERIEKESGPDGLPTDVIAREQQARVTRTEFQRVDGSGRIAGAGDPDAIQPGVRDSERPKRGGIPPSAPSE